jgi:hypothetical protein
VGIWNCGDVGIEWKMKLGKGKYHFIRVNSTIAFQNFQQNCVSDTTGMLK